MHNEAPVRESERWRYRLLEVGARCSSVADILGSRARFCGTDKSRRWLFDDGSVLEVGVKTAVGAAQ
jgi:hypothetical protein